MIIDLPDMAQAARVAVRLLVPRCSAASWATRASASAR